MLLAGAFSEGALFDAALHEIEERGVLCVAIVEAIERGKCERELACVEAIDVGVDFREHGVDAVVEGVGVGAANNTSVFELVFVHFDAGGKKSALCVVAHFDLYEAGVCGRCLMFAVENDASLYDIHNLLFLVSAFNFLVSGRVSVSRSKVYKYEQMRANIVQSRGVCVRVIR